MAELYSVVYASLVAQVVKNLPAMLETRVLTLGQEVPLDRGMATQSCILAWKIPWAEEPGGLQSKELQKVGHDWATNTHMLFIVHCPYHIFFIHSSVYGHLDCFMSWLEKEMATHSGTLAWKIPWMEEPGRLQSTGSQRVGHDWTTSLHSLHFTSHFIIGEGNGNPLQFSCLENPMGAWRAMVHGVAESWIWLKWLSSCLHYCQ